MNKVRIEVLLGLIFFVTAKITIAATIDISTLPSYNSYIYQNTSTSLEGIRGNNIVGLYTIPGGINSGGLLYQSVLSDATVSPYPVATSNGVNFPGAISNAPYGPTFGTANGILQVVGSYKTSSPGGDFGYLYDAAAASGSQYINLIPVADAVNVIPHSIYGVQAVGNYDTKLLSGNAFLYNTATGEYSSLNKPGALSTTAYGVYGNQIVGGFGDATGGHGYILNQTTGIYRTYDAPGVGTVVTHFEGITGAGQAGTYNLIANSVDGTGVHAWVVHIDASGNATWIPYNVGSSITTADAIYQGNVIGNYTLSGGALAAYEVTIPGIYTPISNSAILNNTTPNTAALLAAGNDVINSGSITTSGINSQGIASGYNNISNGNFGGVITNTATGSISASGSGSAAVLMQGNYGVLLNQGLITASAGAYAINTDNTSIGTQVVNSGTIDGQVFIGAGLTTRFENSGWMGITSEGAGVKNQISGTFIQTSTGTLGLRVSPAVADSLVVNGAAKIGGALIVAATGGTYGAARYSLVNASGGLSGVFSSFSTNLVNATNLFYDANNVYLNIYQFTTAQTQQSLVNTANALAPIYSLQNSVIVNSFTYDCTLFDVNNICISAGGRNTAVSAANGLNNTSALLIAAYRPHPNYRVGAYADQNLSVSNAGSTVNLSNNTPLLGLFGAWNERLDGTGTEVKVSAAYGQKNTTITRQVVGTSEAGSGSSQLNSQGAQVMAKYGFGVVKDVIVSPYAGIRYTQNNMGGYTEGASGSVTAPLTYSALNTNATTALAGIGASYQFIPQAVAFASAGVETDTNTSNGTYSATGITGLTPVNFNPNPVRTRPTAMVGAYYDIVKNQRLGVTGIYRQEAYQAVTSTTVMATYTIGL